MLATRSDLPTHSCKTVAADANDATWNVGPAPRQLMLMMLATLGRLMLMMLGARVAPPETIASDAHDARGRVLVRLMLTTRAATLALSEAHDACHTVRSTYTQLQDCGG